MTFSVVPGGQAALNQIVEDAFQATGNGALRLISNEPIAAVARIYNDQRANPAVGGTFGQFSPGQKPEGALQAGALPMLSNRPATDQQGYRTNVGYFNPWPETIEVTFAGKKPDGSSLGATTLTLPPFANKVESVFSVISSVPADQRTQEDFFVTFSARKGVFVFASVVDNKTNDAINVVSVRFPPPTPAPAATATPTPTRPVPTATTTPTVAAPTATPTGVVVVPTATATSVPPTATPTATGVPPTATHTATSAPSDRHRNQRASNRDAHGDGDSADRHAHGDGGATDPNADCHPGSADADADPVRCHPLDLAEHDLHAQVRRVPRVGRRGQPGPPERPVLRQPGERAFQGQPEHPQGEAVRCPNSYLHQFLASGHRSSSVTTTDKANIDSWIMAGAANN